jgi:hypothetical protein
MQLVEFPQVPYAWLPIRPEAVMAIRLVRLDDLLDDAAQLLHLLGVWRRLVKVEEVTSRIEVLTSVLKVGREILHGQAVQEETVYQTWECLRRMAHSPAELLQCDRDLALSGHCPLLGFKGEMSICLRRPSCMRH